MSILKGPKSGLNLPDKVSRSCPDPEILGTCSKNACEGGAAQAKPSQIRPGPDAEKGGSRDPAAMEET